MEVNFKKDMVVYQIYPRSYQDSNADGIGDIPGIIQRLDYIASLGVNAIWLSPVYASPNDDNGYDISDYCAIHPDFGTMADFDLLVSEAKKRGIGIVMDLVINHTSDEHIWFQKALAGEEKYRNYYIIEKGINGKLPNNWGNFFAECPWTPFGDSDEYYLHLFSKKQPDLNWKNPDVYNEVADILRFWLDKGVIGFRCDVINVIYKDTLANGKKRIALTGSEHYLSTDGCHDILNRLRTEILQPYGAFTVGETVLVNIQQAKDLTDPQRAELDMIFAFEHMECDQIGVKWFKIPLSPKRLMKTLCKWQTQLDWNSCYFENHDQPRFISRFRDSDAFRKECSMMVAGLDMTLRGTPYVYEGQEIGMTNGDFQNMDQIRDIESHNIYALATKLHFPKALRWKMIQKTSRDHARTPMQWSKEANAGFTTGTPWLQVNANYPQVNVASEEADDNGILAFWRYMIRLRKENPVLREGAFYPAHIDRRVFAYERALDKDRLLCVFNFTGKKAKLPKHLAQWDQVIACNYHDLSPTHLKPFEFRLMRFSSEE